MESGEGFGKKMALSLSGKDNGATLQILKENYHYYYLTTY